MAVMAWGNCPYCIREYLDYGWLIRHVKKVHWGAWAWFEQNWLPKIISHVLGLRKIWNQPKRWRWIEKYRHLKFEVHRETYGLRAVEVPMVKW